MLEKDMEELIALYPTEFFPRHKFTLVDRQGSFPGVGHYDLLFKDSRGTNTLMELEARPARHSDAEQLAKHNDAVKSRREERVVLWLVATNIQPSIRKHLEDVGIEYTEIPVAEYYRIAERHDFQVTYGGVAEVEPPRPTSGRGVSRRNSASSGHTRSEMTDEEFLRRVSALEEGFQVGHKFLTELADDRFNDFRLGAHSNAHLYFSRDKDDKNDFYAYIKASNHAIQLISRPNVNIWGEAHNKSELLFGPPLDELVTELRGFNVKNGWASPQKLGITLSNKTPAEFFERLLEKIREVHR